jgi:hypothetical protein
MLQAWEGGEHKTRMLEVIARLGQRRLPRGHVGRSRVTISHRMMPKE